MGVKFTLHPLFFQKQKGENNREESYAADIKKITPEENRNMKIRELSRSEDPIGTASLPWRKSADVPVKGIAALCTVSQVDPSRVVVLHWCPTR